MNDARALAQIMRTALYEAARCLLVRPKKWSSQRA
jgi:hypothetical protein